VLSKGFVEDTCLENSKDSSGSLTVTRDSKWIATACDCAVLCLATVLPVILQIRHLGFYADDLGNLGRFHGHKDTTIADYFNRLYSLPGTRGRPIMDLYLAVLYRAFDVHYISYHVVNAVVIFASVVLFYFTLRLVLEQRFVALTVPLIFALLPNYSSARIVPCTFMIGLSLAFFFLNVYALLKAVSKVELSAAWACVSVFSILTSGLLYEILVPLFALNLLVAWEFRRRKPMGERLRARFLLLLLVANAGALLSVVVFKRLTATRPHELAGVRFVLRQALVVHFYKLGLRLPVVAAKVILVYRNPVLDLLALTTGVLFFLYFLRLQRSGHVAETSPNVAHGLVGFGVLSFGCALTVFLASGGATGFTATGFENRTAIGASLGMAFIFSGVSIWLGNLLKVQRAFIVSLVIALLCTCELLAASTVGSFWATAAEQQELVLNAIQHDIPALAPNSALLLDGVCPYIGPGIVFEGHQDMGGALQMVYRDPSLRGDVVSPRLQVHQDGIETSIYGRSRYYLYGNLKVYDFRARKVWGLPDIRSAVEYFGAMGPVHSFCPEGTEGNGVAIF
jgi:hypothetical protein